MSLLRRCHAGISLTLVCAAAPAMACAEDQRDAAANPCCAHPKLVVRQADQGFAITRLDPAIPAQIAPEFGTPTEIAIGAAMKIDRSVFMTSLVQLTGGKDARR
jgi:hypothetical protein